MTANRWSSIINAAIALDFSMREIVDYVCKYSQVNEAKEVDLAEAFKTTISCIEKACADKDLNSLKFAMRWNNSTLSSPIKYPQYLYEPKKSWRKLSNLLPVDKPTRGWYAAICLPDACEKMSESIPKAVIYDPGNARSKERGFVENGFIVVWFFGSFPTEAEAKRYAEVHNPKITGCYTID